MVHFFQFDVQMLCLTSSFVAVTVLCALSCEGGEGPQDIFLCKSQLSFVEVEIIIACTVAFSFVVIIINNLQLLLMKVTFCYL